MAALPPDQTEIKFDGDEDSGPRIPDGFTILTPEPPTIKQTIWNFAQVFLLFCVFAALGAYIGQLGFETITGIDATFKQAFATIFLLRIAGIAFNTR